MPSVWLSPRREGRGRRPSLSRERIVAAAVGLLDEEGLEGLSIRRLAERLDVGAMSLYWHVSNKDALLELAADEVLGETRLPVAPSGDWRKDLRELAAGLRDVVRRHPWSAALFGSHPSIGPNGLAYTEAGLGALARAGLIDQRLDGAFSAVFGYAVGFAVVEASWEATLRRTGLDEAGWMDTAMPYLESATEGRHPALAAYLERGLSGTQDERFAFGLELVLDGVQGQSTTRPREGRG